MSYICTNIYFFKFLFYFDFLFFNIIYLFIYFCLHWVFVAARGLSLVAESGGYSSLRCRGSHCGGFSCCGARALGVRAQ